MMMRRIAALVIPLLVLAPSSWAGAAGGTFEGTDCEELGYSISADAGVVREYVPDDFTMVGEETGSVSVLIAAWRCEEFEVDGVPRGRAIQSDVGVVIDPPDSTQSMHLYQLWATSSLKEFAALLGSLAIDGGHVRGTTYDSDAKACTGICPPIVGIAESSVPWREGSYRLRAAALGPPAPAPFLAATWWHVGDQGLVSVRYRFDVKLMQYVRGTLMAQGPGERMRELLGSDRATLDGVLWTFDTQGEARAE